MVPMSKSERKKEALEYLRTVRGTFKDNREKYNDFLKVMKHLKCDSMCRSYVKSRVKELLKDHQELIFGFNTFMPKYDQIALESEQTQPDQTLRRRPNLGDALDFFDNVKARFQDDARYQAFRAMLRMYEADKISICELYAVVFYGYFRNHHDLRVEFSYFIENSSLVGD